MGESESEVIDIVNPANYKTIASVPISAREGINGLVQFVSSFIGNNAKLILDLV